MCAVDYLLRWCPYGEELLIHATWLDFERLQKNFRSVEYFVQRFSHIFLTMDMESFYLHKISLHLLKGVLILGRKILTVLTYYGDILESRYAPR